MSDELPPGWALTDIGTLGRYVNGRGFGKDEWKKVGLPIIRIQNLNDESAEFNYTDQEHESKYRVTDGDLLVAWAASLGVYYWNRGPAWLNQHIFRVEVEERAVTKPFLYYTLKHALEGLYKKAHGSGMVHVTKGKFDSHPVKLPPLNEQKRIVSKIDELFSRIDEGERALERVQKLVERYRQSVLKAAVTGELTRDWREKNRDKLESGEALLARILKARREAWEKAELDKMKAKGITPANDKWKQKYEEPAGPEITGLPGLPQGWFWASVDQLAHDVAYGTSAKCSDDASGVPVIRMGNIDAGELDTSSLKYLPEDHTEFPSLLLQSGDLLFNRTNSAELVGKSAVFRIIDGRWSFASYLIRVRSAVIPAEWLAHFINSAFGRAWVGAVKNQQVGQANVNGSKLKALAIPIPPLDELAIALDAVAREFSRVDAAASANTVEFRRSAAIRQSVLRIAFLGQLIAQDPDDEPASELLQRIATERSEAPAKPKRGRKPKTSERA